MAGFLTNVGHVFSTLGHQMVEGMGQPAPQYQVDPQTGTTVPVQGEPAPGQMFKNLLVGALSGLAAGAQVRGGFGAQVGAGFEAAQQQKVRQDQLARANAQQQFENQQQTQQNIDLHTMRQAQLAALQQKTIQDAAAFDQAQKKGGLEIGKMEQDLADSYNANLMAGAKPFQHMGQEVPAFNTLQQAEDFANSHPEDVVAGFTTQIHRTPDGKWQITQLPTTEQEYTFNIGGKEIKQRMTPAQAQAVYNAQLSAKKTNADIAEANARTNLLNKQANTIPDANDMSDDSLVDGMINGTIDITKTASIRNNRREMLIRKAMQKDPSFNMSTYPLRLKTVQSFGPDGKMGQQVMALNTFTGHAGDASQLIDTLRNTSIPAVNTPLNKFREGVLGNDKIPALKTALEAAKDEYFNFLKAGHAPTKEEIDLGNQLLNTDQSPAQMEATLKQMAKTVMIRARSINSSYRAAMGGKDYPSMLNGDSAQILRNFGYGNEVQRFGIDGNAPSAQQTAAPQGRPVIQDGKIIGYTTDGKTMTPVQ
jgi:hypothetical protein